MKSKNGWDTTQANFKNKCVICGKSEKKVGALEKTHIKEHARIRYLVLPMCANHHKMYAKDQLSNKDLKKIEIIIQSYEKSRSVINSDKHTRVPSPQKIGVS